MDGVIGPLCRQDAVLPANRLRQDLRRNIADGQSLAHGLQDRGVGQTCRQRIDGQYPPGSHRGAVQPLKGGIGHAVTGVVPGEGAVENEFRAVLELFGGIFTIEKC